jgi:hypothetical protein
LQLSDIIAPDHRGPAVQESVTETPARLNQGRPRLATTDPVDAKAPPMLKGLYGRPRAGAKPAVGVDATGESEGVQPGLHVDNCRPNIAGPEGE